MGKGETNKYTPNSCARMGTKHKIIYSTEGWSSGKIKIKNRIIIQNIVVTPKDTDYYIFEKCGNKEIGFWVR